MGSARTRTLTAIGAIGVVAPIVAVVGSSAGDSIDAAAVAVTAPTTAPSGARLEVVGDAGAAGGSTRIAGAGFPADASGSVAVAGRRVAAITTTTGGRFSRTIRIPTNVRGSARVTATVAGRHASITVAVGGAKRTSAVKSTNATGGVVVMAVGDMTGGRGSDNAVAVRNVVRAQRPAKILMLGDYQYHYGSLSEIRRGADRLWGPKPAGLWRKMMPTAGPTHDVTGCGRSDYERYWGRPAMKGYSFDVGSWHVIQLPSAVFRYDCNPAAVTRWLKADLAAHPNRCTLAFMHEPYWTRPTDEHGRQRDVRPWIVALQRAGVEMVLSGHQHNYQRFRPQTATDRRSATGIRAFVVGTGGVGSYGFDGRAANVAASSAGTYGALRLILRPGSYSWKFMRVSGARFSDSGSATCH